MKTLILLLSVNMALVVSAIPLAHRDIYQANLEKIIEMAGNYVTHLPEVHLKTLVKDLTHLTGTTVKCMRFFCEAEGILASLEHELFGERGEIVRSLRKRNHPDICPAVNQIQVNQVELKQLLRDLKQCGQKINSNKALS